MHYEYLKFPQWQVPLQELVLEFDPQKLPEKIQRVETLLFERLQKLDDGRDSRVEKLALYDAQTMVRIMKRNRLG
jgi:hypothetical protein